MTQIFLGEPPANVKQWIIDHASAPSELTVPLYFEGQEPGATVAMIAWNDETYEPEEHLQCHLESSTDGMSTWQVYDGEIISLDECTDNRVYFRAPEGQPNTDGFASYDEENDMVTIYHAFKVENAVKAGGNIQFLLESTGTRTDVPAYAFYQMFGMSSYDEEIGDEVYQCASLTTAPALPATTLAGYCYFYMFYGCTSLTQAPSLPATALANSCYSGMFYGCTSLTQAPSLPATTLTNSCYSGMFNGCVSLTQAPSLPATTLTNNCYSYMFQDCTSLTTAPALQAMTLASRCYFNMFRNCTSLTQAPSLPATALTSSCYSSMFRNCMSLTTAPALPATTLDSDCYSYMFYDCNKLTSMDVSFTTWNMTNATQSWMVNAGSQAEGTKTFTCPADLPNKTGDNEIPSGWTRVDK